MLRALFVSGWLATFVVAPPVALAQIDEPLVAALTQTDPPPPASAPAQATPRPAESTPEVPTKVVVIRPAVEPKRALRHSLLPDFLDRVPGNAAVGYMKAGLLMPKPTPGQEDPQEKISKWLECPLEEFPAKEVEEFLNPYATAIKTLTSAARRQHCDWELPVREEQFLAILLPEVQESRGYARVVMLQTRLQIKLGQYDEALKSIQTGYAMARHVAEGPTLINGLVAIAIGAMTSERVLELAQQPGAPSLYWPLTVLPQPLIGLHRALETERDILYLSYPQLRNLDQQVLSVEQAQSIVHKLVRDLQSLGGDAQAASVATTMVALAIYPSAKAALIAEGMDRERVEAMPVAQVLLIQALRRFDESRDALFRAMYLPYREASPYLDAANREINDEFAVFLPLARMLLPALNSVRLAEHRSERIIAALRTVEALRLHAGKEGRLPDSLSDVRVVPVPTDPLSGEPFVYRRDGDSGVLEAKLPPGVAPHYGLRYELRLQKD